MDRYDELAVRWKALGTGFQTPNAWKLLSQEVGFERAPQQESKAVLTALAKAHVSDNSMVEPGTPDEDQLALANLLASEHDPNWTELARLSKRVLAKVAAGILESETGQVSALKEVIGRAEGRIGADAEDKEEKTHILILPVEDDGQGPSVIVPSNLEE